MIKIPKKASFANFKKAMYKDIKRENHVKTDAQLKKKLGLREFNRVQYFIVKGKRKGIAGDFYDDYLHSKKSLDKYIKSTSK